MGKTGHEWQRLAIRSRDGEEEIALPLSFRMHGFHVALSRSRRHDTRGFHLPYLWWSSSPASQNKYHLTHFCLQEAGKVFVWKSSGPPTKLPNCTSSHHVSSPFRGISCFRRMRKVLDGGFGVTEATAILFAEKHRKKSKSVFPSTLERRILIWGIPLCV